jgi:hypothetical protein
MSSKKRKKRAVRWLRVFYGLGKKEVERLGNRPVKVRVSLYPRSVEWLFPLKPRQRRRALKKWHRCTFERITTALPFENAQLRTDHLVSYLEGELPGKYLLDLAAQPGLSMTFMIEGFRRKKLKSPKRRWYAVRARFAIQVERQTKGRQSYEDRIVLVRAKSFKHAMKRFRKSVKTENYSAPYLNSRGRMVRWHLERIIYVYETDLKHVSSDDTEVYSHIKTRKMKPKYEWHPRRHRDNQGH